MPVDLLANAPTTSGGPKDLLAGKDLLADKDAPSDKPSVEKNDSVLGGMKRGFLERGIGVDEALNEIGAGGVVPQFVNGKIVFGLPPNEQLDKYKDMLEEEGKGTGLKGFVAELAGDPLNILPGGKMGMMAKGAVQAGLSGLLSPAQNADQTLVDRLRGAVISAPIGAATGGLLGKFGAKPTGAVTEASPLYKAVNQLGIKLTGKETPEVIWNKIQTALKDKVDSLAEKVSPGSSISEAWHVGTNLAISQTYGAVRKQVGKLFDDAKEVGSKLTTQADDLLAHLDNTIKDAETDTVSPGLNPKFKTALQKLESLRDNLLTNNMPKDPMQRMAAMLAGEAEGAKAPVKVRGDQLIEMDQALNQLYGKKGQGGAAGKAYADLQAKVNETIKGMEPTFAAGYQKAKDLWKSQVIQRFKENDALKKFWEPEDYQAFTDMAAGKILNPNVQTRVMNQLDRIKDWNGLAVLKKALPPQMYDTLRSAKMLDILRTEGLDLKAVTDKDANALLEKAVGNNLEAQTALDAIKTFTEQMQKRSIMQTISPAELAESDKMMDRSVRTVLGFATRHKLYGLSHAWDLIANKAPKSAPERLLNLSADVAKGAPKAVTESGAAFGVPAKVLETGEGEGVSDLNR